MSIKYSINSNNVYESFFPVGCIIAYIGTQASGSPGYDPDGWLVCDGRAFPSGSTYNALRIFLGNPSTIPDLRAAFLRGTGTCTQYSPSDNQGPLLQTFQSDTIKSHNHALVYNIISKGGTGGSRSLTLAPGNNTSTRNTFIIRSGAGVQVDSTTDTRPINYSVKWIIKY